MSHVTSRRALVLIAVFTSAALAHGQDPIPVAYWSHPRPQHWRPPGVNAFAPPPAPAYYNYPGPQMTTAPYGMPEAGVRAPFVIPPNAGHGHKHGHPHLHAFFHAFKPRPPILNDSLPTHPYARGPRDFFMFHENLEAERSRDLRPIIVP